MDFSGSEIFWPNKYEIWSEMGPYGSVGAHIKTGRSPMAQDHFKTPPDPKKGHGMTKNPQKSKTSSRVDQVFLRTCQKIWDQIPENIFHPCTH